MEVKFLSGLFKRSGIRTSSPSCRALHNCCSPESKFTQHEYICSSGPRLCIVRYQEDTECFAKLSEPPILTAPAVLTGMRWRMVVRFHLPHTPKYMVMTWCLKGSKYPNSFREVFHLKFIIPFLPQPSLFYPFCFSVLYRLPFFFPSL